MASTAFSHRESIRQIVLISSVDAPRQCMASIDPDCWTPDSRPVVIGGVLDLSREELGALAGADRLILTLCENGEPYRMILDAITGRFLARKL